MGNHRLRQLAKHKKNLAGKSLYSLDESEASSKS